MTMTTTTAMIIFMGTQRWPEPIAKSAFTVERTTLDLSLRAEASPFGAPRPAKAAILLAIAGAEMFNLPFGPPSRSLARPAVVALACLAVAASLVAQTAADNPAAACAAKNRDVSAKVGDFTFATYSSKAGVCLQVVLAGKVVFRRAVDSMESFTLGQPASTDGNYFAIPNGTDVTGRAHPDMVVSLFTGGAHCCTTHYVFELAPAFRLLATLNDADDDLAHFERDATNRRYYYHTADWTFAYWPTCFACSPSELVVLRWVDEANGGAFHLALDKMQKPAPMPAEWNKSLAAARKVVSQGDTSSIGTTLWQTVLDLIYTGHSDLAWKFVNAAGPRAQQKPFPSLTDFCGLLKQSPYWPDLGPSLKHAPAACSSAGPAANK
jgi:hypothetical protein